MADDHICRRLAPAIQMVNLESSDAQVRVQLQAPRSLRIRLIDDRGQPIAGAKVRASTWHDVWTLTWNATTDAEGRVAWNEAPADEVTYTIVAPDEKIMDAPLVADDQEQTVRFAPTR